MDPIRVDRSERSLSLIRGGRAVRVHPVGLGFAAEGDKERQGDGRTPEGRFRIDRVNRASRFHLPLGLDNPQPDDVARAAGATRPAAASSSMGSPGGWASGRGSGWRGAGRTAASR